MRVRGPRKAGVIIEVSQASFFPPLLATTSGSGQARFTDLAPGGYSVTPRKTGGLVTPDVTSVTITDGAVTRVMFDAKKMPKSVGTVRCLACHTRSTEDAYQGWLNGAHGNFNLYDATTGRTARYSDFLASFNYPADAPLFVGSPSTASSDEAMKVPGASNCYSCHGPRAGDNLHAAHMPLVKADGTVDNENKTQASRPVVGCEACHGGGEFHAKAPSLNKIPYKVPLAAQCGSCHDYKYPADHLTRHPAGAGGDANAGVYEAWLGSPHAMSVKPSIISDRSNNTVLALCAKCHTDQGGILYKDKNGDTAALGQLFANEPALKNARGIECRTCHDGHDTTKLLRAATAATATATARSAQFNTCTNCHQLLSDSDSLIQPFHPFDIGRNHWDDPATQALEGYNINRASDTACSTCHNSHTVDNTIHKQWAESGHGTLTSAAWMESDWKGNSRVACQRCHTTTGFANRVTDRTGYDAAIAAGRFPNNFSHLTGLQEEMLYCGACHKDSAFTMRTVDSVLFPSNISASLGNDSSNLCMECHQGRGWTGTVTAKFTKNPPYTFVNNHYGAAAASYFGSAVKCGYEYTGKTYAPKQTYPAHTAVNKVTCVGCHMRQGKPEEPDHHFDVEVGDCNSCHTGISNNRDLRPANLPDFDGDGNLTEGLYYEIEGFQTALLAQIKYYALNTSTYRKAIAFDPHTYPYFYYDANGNGAVDTGEVAYAYFDAALLKAAYNYFHSVKDPGGWAHNYRYILQLLYDSLEGIGGTVSNKVRPYNGA